MTRRGRASSPGLTTFRVVLGLLAVLVLLVGVAFTAANVVQETSADETKQSVDRTKLAPTECSGLALDNTISGSVVIAGTLGNDWIIGSGAVDTIEGLAGGDCIEGKAEADVIDGGPGNDVCLGGPGVDTFLGCETEIQ